MAIEARLQTKIVKLLKSEGFWVMVLSPNSGVPDGHPDVIGLKNGYYVAIEVKASENAEKQPLQQYTIDLLKNHGGFAYFVWPDNWPDIEARIKAMSSAI